MTFPGPNGKRHVPQIPRAVQVDAVAVACMVAGLASPGAPLQVGPAQAIRVPDFGPALAQVQAQVAASAETPTADEADRLEILEAVANFQARIAAISERIKARMEAEGVAPEPPGGGIVIAKDMPPEPPAHPSRLRKVE